MSDAERIAREVCPPPLPVSPFVERALIEAARRGIALGRSRGACTPAEREFIEARMALEPLKIWYPREEAPDMSRWERAFDALVAERKPKPKWSADRYYPYIARGPNGEQRTFWKSGNWPDPETCAAEVERLNAEAR